ncbi:MAG: ATP-binding cassette domain-containing protein [Clostridiaceae bacterium]|nr:ATP-binding cassette domain-containing protein [Clostridiaceae bacterium]
MLQVKNISKSFKTADFVQKALDGVSIDFRKNEFVAILGPSGSGKSTLLNIIGGLDKYDTGDLIINGASTKKYKDRDWDAYRNNSIGFIFQNYNLINHITILDNVEMGLRLSGVSKKTRKEKAKKALEQVGLKDHMHKKPNQLSGGQMQRVAIARALVNNPDIIMADEPTGALDSKTSIQIMELIKEIAKEKLVIMVTHNAELAEEYSTRIIEIRDGKVIKDSNPLNKEDGEQEKYKLIKTSMGFFSALKLSFNNIKTKKGRTILTAFASSIGMIGIALILSLSNGFNIQIEEFERDTLSQMPIMISKQTMNVTEEDLQKSMNETNKENKFTTKQEIYPLEEITNMVHTNKITKEYEEYIKNIDKDLISGIGFQRTTKLNVLTKIDEKVKMIDVSKAFFPLPEKINEEQMPLIENNFDLIYGKMPENKEELGLLIDTQNRLSKSILEILGYKKEEAISFDEILNKEFKIVLNDELYEKIGKYFIVNTDYEKLYNNEKTITLKITGIIRGKENNTFAEYSGTGCCYKEKLAQYVIENNKNSKIVKAQIDANYNVLTGEKFDTTDEGITTKDTILSYLGDDKTSIIIQVYPKDFNTKDKIIEYLDKYNEEKSEDDRVVYTDYAEAITSLSGGIIDAITVVLIAFSAISLVVSSIMIGIITYISVLERTKEIGILRAIGARKKDITRVFNAETFIIGMCSGVLAIGITYALIFPINIIIKELTDLANVAKLNPIHAIILIVISIILTLIGGFIPAKIAAKKDPVVALRTE